MEPDKMMKGEHAKSSKTFHCKQTSLTNHQKKTGIPVRRDDDENINDKKMEMIDKIQKIELERLWEMKITVIQ